MKTDRKKWRADRGTRALNLLANIEASIAELADEDLLDLADIFSEKPQAAINDLASAEMLRRNIGL